MIKKITNFFLRNTTSRQTVVKNTAWLLLGNVGSRFIRVILIVYAARLLGAANWGAFSYILSLVALLSVFLDLGIHMVTTRETAKRPELRSQYLATGASMKLAMLVVMAVVVLVIAPHIIRESSLTYLLPLAVLLTGIDSFRDFGASLARAWERMEIEGVSQIVTNVAIVAAGFIALLLSPSVHSLLGGYVIGAACGLVAVFIPFRGYFSGWFKNFSSEPLKLFFSSGWAVSILSIMSAVLLNTDVIVLKAFRDLTQVGYYGAAQRASSLLYMIPPLIAASLFPQMAKSFGDKERVRRVIEGGAAAMVFITAPLTILSVILSGGIINLLYSQVYSPSSPIFAVMGLTFVPSAIIFILNDAIFALKGEKKLALLAIVSMAGNLILDLLLIPRYGGTGSAVATFVNLVILLILMYAVLRKQQEFTLLPGLKKIITASALMAAWCVVLTFLGVGVAINIISSSLVYLAVLVALKEPVLREIKNLTRLPL